MRKVVRYPNRYLHEVLNRADNLQTKLIREGAYGNGATQEIKLARSARWIENSLHTLFAYGTWCPDGQIKIDG